MTALPHATSEACWRSLVTTIPGELLLECEQLQLHSVKLPVFQNLHRAAGRASNREQDWVRRAGVVLLGGAVLH